MFAKQANAPAPAVAASPAQAAAPAGPKPVATVTLKAPIEGQAGTIRQIALRAPRLADYLDCGEIMKLSASGAIGADGKPETLNLEVDRWAVMRWLERLSGHNAHELGQLSMGDYRSLEREVRTLVDTDQGNSPSGPTSSSSSSA